MVRKKYNIDIEKLCEEYLVDGATTRSLAKKYGCGNGTMHTWLSKSNNGDVIRKLRKKNISIIIYRDEEKFGIVANNTKNIFFFPIYLEEVMRESSWNEINSGYLKGRIFGDSILAHHLVSGFPLNGLECDHKDRNKQNNLPDNLRIVDKSTNRKNVVKTKYTFIKRRKRVDKK